MQESQASQVSPRVTEPFLERYQIGPRAGRLSLELVSDCNEFCVHCYAESGPKGRARATEANTLTGREWCSILVDGARFGFTRVQFIGGEPTLHPSLGTLVALAHQLGMQIEVYSNLLDVSSDLWKTFVLNRVSLATSLYSLEPRIHDQITRTTGSHAATVANLRKARELGLKVRASVIKVHPSQDIDPLVAWLESEGVHQVTVDRMRRIGRARTPIGDADLFRELCGRCSDGGATVSTVGDVFPCVFCRVLGVGNIRVAPLSAVLTSEAWFSLQDRLRSVFSASSAGATCGPSEKDNGCGPTNRSSAMYEGCGPNEKETPSCGPYRRHSSTQSSCAPDAPTRPDEGCGPTRSGVGTSRRSN